MSLLLERDDIEIHFFKVGEMRTNCYLVIEPKNELGMVVDPGDEGDFISEEILQLGVKIKYLVLTHSHFDHLGGLLPLKLNFPQAKILASGLDKKIYQAAARSALYWQGQAIDPPPPIDEDLEDIKQFELGRQKWQVIATPGHTPGGKCFFYQPKNRQSEPILLSGDTIFALGAVGRTDFVYASQEKLQKSLEKLWKLPPATLVLPGHGRTTTIGDEKTIAAFSA